MAIRPKKPIKSAKSNHDNAKIEEVTVTCGCNRDITATELGKIYKSQKRQTIEELLPYLNKTMNKYGISSCIRKSHFLAQIGHESGQLSLLAETLGKGVQEKDVYDGYKGRGLIQITYKTNYESYGSFTQHDFTGSNRTDLEKKEWASDSAGWYWSIKQSPDLSNFADKNDLIYISQSINGAFNGYDDRKLLLSRAANALLVDSCQHQNQCWNMENFIFSNSAANEISAAAFGWGLWHDPKSSKSGTSKDKTEALIEYNRFLEIKGKQKKGRFGFKTPKKMIEHAEARIDELDKE